MVCMARVESVKALTASVDRDLTRLWVVDSGSERHLSCRRDWFEDFIPHPISVKGVGGGIIREMGGHGSIRIPCLVFGKKTILHLRDVVYSPSAGVNLVSTGCLTIAKVDVLHKEDWVQLSKAEFCIRGRRVGTGLYFLDTCDSYDNITTLVACHISDETTLETWHKRMGHTSEQNLKRVAKQVDGMDLDAPPPKSHLCESCVMGKCKNNPHKGHLRQATRVNEIIHTDVIGPFKVAGTNRARYIITFLDDFTNYSEVFLMEFKSDAVSCFKKYFNANISKGPFGSVHSDNGGEYLAHELQSFFNQEGIQWETSCPYTPQQNGRSERLGQDLQTKGAALQYEASNYGEIPAKFWPEFIRTANHLRNFLVLSRQGTTAFQAHEGERPNLSHIRVIGCHAYALNHKAKKLDPRAIKCRLLGYEGNSIYRLLTPDNKVVRHSSVHFDERLVAESAPKRQRVSEECSERGEMNSASSEPPSFDTPGPRSSCAPNGVLSTTSPRINPPPELQLQNGEKQVMTAPGIWETAIQVEDRTAIEIPGHLHNPHFRVNFQRCLLTTALLCKESDDLSEPESYEDLMNPENFPNDIREKYEGGMTDEFDSLIENHTWELVPPPSGYQKKVLRGKWVYKIKRGANGEITRYKARWVVRGFEQQEGIDYHETFASVVKPMSYKTLFALAAAKDLEIEQMDVKTAFLYGDIDEEIYVEQPPGFDDGTGRVCRLNKGLYGLKQAPRIWYTTLATFLKSLGYHAINSDSGIFRKGRTYVAVYVDDLLIVGPSKAEIQSLKDALNQKFKMTDLGPCAYYLGMEVSRDRPRRVLRLSQRGYLEKVLKEFKCWRTDARTIPMRVDHRLDAAPPEYSASNVFKKKYQSAVGSLMYAMLGTRPDIAFAVSMVSRFAHNPTETHWKAVEQIFGYLNKTIDFELVFRGDLKPLTGYSDADWAGDLATSRSTGGYAFNLGSATLSWSSKRQPTVALSSCEAEYMAQTQAAKEAIWLRGLKQDLDPDDTSTATIIFCDNQAAISLAKNFNFSTRAKHIKHGHRFVNQAIEEKEIELQYINTKRQVADGFTKALPKDSFQNFCRGLGLESSSGYLQLSKKRLRKEDN